MPLQWGDIVEVEREQAKQDLLELLESVGFTATSWQEFSIALATVEIGADLREKLSQVAVFLKEVIINRTSTGDGLTRFSYSHYKNNRQTAVACQRKITLACAVGQGPHTYNPGDLVATDGTHTYRNVEGNGVVYPFILAGGASKQFLFEAEVAGAAATVGSGTVTSLVTTFAGVTITEDLLSTNGSDEESDPKLQTRNETKWATLSRFELIKDAVESIALDSAAGVAQVGVDDQNPRGAGTFDVYVAGEATTAGIDDVNAVQAGLAARVFGSDTVRTYAAPTVTLDLAGTVYYDSKYTEADVRAAVEGDTGSLLTFIKSIPLGGFDFAPGPSHAVPKNDIESTIKDTEISKQKPVKTVVLSTPAADIGVASFGKVIKGIWTLDYVKITAQ